MLRNPGIYPEVYPEVYPGIYPEIYQRRNCLKIGIAPGDARLSPRGFRDKCGFLGINAGFSLNLDFIFFFFSPPG